MPPLVPRHPLANPCNCFGTHGQMETDEFPHEMEVTKGCRNKIADFYPVDLHHNQAPGEKSSGDAPHDPVTMPAHYRRFKIEPVRFIMENDLPFWMGNVIKYILRHDAKNGLEDMKKARRYLDMEIARMEGSEDFWK